MAKKKDPRLKKAGVSGIINQNVPQHKKNRM